MSFLGGLIKTGFSAIAHSNPLTGAIYDAAGALAQKRQAAGGSGPADALLLKSGGSTVSGGLIKGSAGSAPPLPGVSIIKSQLGADPSKFRITPGATTKGHYTKRGMWSSRRRPRMNPANGSAIRRAARRIKAAEKLFRRVLSISHPGHAAGRIKPKFGRKR